MTYTRVNWQDEPSTATPTSAANFNIMDLGIDLAHDLVDRFDQTAMATAGDTQFLMFYASSGLWGPRSLLSTDSPGVVKKTISATTYTVLGTDQGRLLHFTAAGSVTVTVPTLLTTMADAIFGWRQYGAGQITWLSGGAGIATVNSRGNALKSAGQYAEGQFTRVGVADEYILSGDITT